MINNSMKISDLTEAPKDKYTPKEVIPFESNHIRYINYAKKLVSYIKSNCRPWLNQTNNGSICVYRGIKHDIKGSLQLAFLKNVRNDRKALDSSKIMVRFFNDSIKLAKKKANRNNSMFVSGDPEIAETYSNSDEAFIVLPIGNFNYTWRTKLGDWTQEIDYDYNVKAEKDVIRFAKTIKGNDGSLIQSIRSKNEIMIQCGAAVYLNKEFYKYYVLPLLNNKPVKSFAVNRIDIDSYF